MSRTHLVTGVAGQDGALLARLLVSRGERVVGTVRPGQGSTQAPGVELVEHDICDIDSFLGLVRAFRPDAVHNLAGLSSVGTSWTQPEATRAVNQGAVEGMLDALLSLEFTPPFFVQASSSEIFGTVAGGRADETTTLAPISPYAHAKAAAHVAVQTARASGLRATNVILFGHTSPLQPTTFVMPSIAQAAAEVAAGLRDAVELRDPSVRRDWGSAQDFVEVFADAVDVEPSDFVVGTGRLHELAEIAGWALAAVGVEGGTVRAAAGEVRPQDFGGIVADAARARTVLGWQPRTTLQQVIEEMARTRLAEIRTG